MATILFSSIINGSTVAFDPASDVLVFDDPAISAASLGISFAADFSAVVFSVGGTQFTLTATVSLAQISTANITFADGSLLLVGDDNINANDILANTLVAGSHDDRLYGLSGNDTLAGAAGADVLDGGSGADLLKGGLGGDTYVVDNPGDVVDETPTVDTLRVSTTDSGAQGNGLSSYASSVSADGRFVVFRSVAANLDPGNGGGGYNIFVKDLQTGTVQCASTDAADTRGNSSSVGGSLSPDGRYVVFQSYSDNLVADDTNFGSDIFLKDLQTGAVQRVNKTASGAQAGANSVSELPSFSPDGRYVVFDSFAGNLVAGDNSGYANVFVKDLQTGAIQLVSIDASGAKGNSNSFRAAFSGDGQHVVFQSSASNLVAGDVNSTDDVFVKNLQTGAVVCASTRADGVHGNFPSQFDAISGDGRYVVFDSYASNLVPTSNNNLNNVYLKDLQTGTLELISADAGGAPGNISSFTASISADGRYVAFYSYADNLVAGDTNGAADVFIKDRETGAVALVSTAGGGAQGNNDSFTGSNYDTPRISADGRYVFFDSNASNLVAGDTNNATDIFRVGNPFITDSGVDTVQSSVTWTLAAGVENLVLTGTAAVGGTGNSLANSLTGNAGANALSGGAGNDTLDGGAGSDSMAGGTGDDTYVVDSSADVVTEFNGPDPQLVSLGNVGQAGNSFSSNGSLTADGRHLVFASDARNLLAGDTNGAGDIFIKDLQTGDVQLVSTAAGGLQGNSLSTGALISADGRFVVFQSYASNLVAGDTNDTADIFTKDLQTGAIQRVNTSALGEQANFSSGEVSLSTMGHSIAFSSNANNLVAGDTNVNYDIFVKDLQTGAIQRVSTDGDGLQANNSSSTPSISADGRQVAFVSYASNLVVGDTNGIYDIFVKDLQSGAVQRVSTNANGVQGNGESRTPTFSADGHKLAFYSEASNLVAGDTNNTDDTFVKDLQTGAIQRVSTDANGAQANGASYNAVFSPDGRYVGFLSDASNLVAGDGNGSRDVFVKDLQTGAIQRISTDAAGVQGNNLATEVHFSADGRQVLYGSFASNLVPGDSNQNGDIFLALNPFVASGGGLDTVRSSASYTLPANVEQLVLTGSVAINATGNTLANTLTGNSASNALNGGAGADTMSGGAGNDSYTVDSAGDVVVEGAGSGNDLVSSSVSHTLAANVERLTLTGSASINGTGNTLNNTLTGNSGNNVLDGGSGNDTMAGGTGNDTYVVGASGDVVTEAASAGTDTVQAAITFSLAALADVENLVLTGSGNLNATGNASNNVLTGNAGNNVLSGGDGSDTASYANATTGVNVNLGFTGAQATGFGSDTLVGIERLTGSAFEDSLIGNDGNNTLDGGAGLDMLIGGAGNDVYVVDSLGDVVIEEANEGTDLVQARNSFQLGDNVENLTLLGSGNTSAVGNALANVVTGNAGNNVLNGSGGTDTASFANATQAVNASLMTKIATGFGSDTLTGFENLTGSSYNDTLAGDAGSNVLNGGSGADTMSGGDGADTYYPDNAGDVVTETNASTASGGIDTVCNSVNWTLGANVENLRINGAGAVNGTGNSLNNVIYAGAGNNVLDGGSGADTVSYAYAGAAVTVSLASSAAQATGGSGSDTLSGFENLVGSNYNDKLTGSAVSNTLTGGAGADNFVFSSALNAGTNRDTVTDFASGSDRLSLDDAVFAGIGPVGALNAGAFYAGTAAHDSSDRVIYDHATGNLYFDADGSGAGAQVQFACLGASTALLATDLWVV